VLLERKDSRRGTDGDEHEVSFLIYAWKIREISPPNPVG
jgi:hypothetical protein